MGHITINPLGYLVDYEMTPRGMVAPSAVPAALNGVFDESGIGEYPATGITGHRGTIRINFIAGPPPVSPPALLKGGGPGKGAYGLVQVGGIFLAILYDISTGVLAFVSDSGGNLMCMAGCTTPIEEGRAYEVIFTYDSTAPVAEDAYVGMTVNGSPINAWNPKPTTAWSPVAPSTVTIGYVDFRGVTDFKGIIQQVQISNVTTPIAPSEVPAPVTSLTWTTGSDELTVALSDFTEDLAVSAMTGSPSSVYINDLFDPSKIVSGVSLAMSNWDPTAFPPGYYSFNIFSAGGDNVSPAWNVDQTFTWSEPITNPFTVVLQAGENAEGTDPTHVYVMISQATYDMLLNPP